jgi:hypothetical protein
MENPQKNCSSENKRKFNEFTEEPVRNTVITNQRDSNRQSNFKTSNYQRGVEGCSPLVGILQTSTFPWMNFDMMHYMASTPFMGERAMRAVDQALEVLARPLPYTSIVSLYKRFLKTSFQKYDADKNALGYLEIDEARAVHEGLFPKSEMVFIFHELIDITQNVGVLVDEKTV